MSKAKVTQVFLAQLATQRKDIITWNLLKAWLDDTKFRPGDRIRVTVERLERQP